MMFFIVLFYSILSPSFQGIPTGFFCYGGLNAVYLVEGGKGGTPKKIVDEIKSPNIYDLDVAPGDLIRITCSGYPPYYGAGCFYLYDQCYCFDFDIDYDRSTTSSRTESFALGGTSCSIKTFPLKVTDRKSYDYEHYIPLDITKISCQNSNNVLIYQTGVDYSLKLSDYITSDYNVKNVQIVITENYNYFKLNNIALIENQKFNIEKQIIFNSNAAKKYHITFRNYGFVLEETKDCGFYIRVCHQGCSDCYDSDVSSDNQQCKACKTNYYLIDGTNNCKTKQEMENTNYYLDTTSNVFKKCYANCNTCSGGGNANDMKCKTCKTNYYSIEGTYNCKTKQEMENTNYYFDTTSNVFKKCYANCQTCSGGGDINDMKCKTCITSKPYSAEPNNCIADITRYYFSTEDNIYKKCYISCYSCNTEGTQSYQNCNECEESYHFVYNQKTQKNCIPESQKPSNTYLDSTTDTYELCYERCSTCNAKGDETNNNCIQCAKDENNNYLYHLLENDNGKCITEDKKPLNTYLDTNNNIFKYCYERCSLCDTGGDETTNNCKECSKDENNNNYLFHFIYNEEKKCISESEKPSDTYLDSSDNTYKKCYERCSTCDKEGNEINNNCKDCLKDTDNNYLFHFIYNEKGRCITEDESPLNVYLDENDNTYKLFYERCASCDATSDECIECFKEAKIIENILEMEEDFVQKINNVTFHITTSFKQKNNPNNSISTINLGNCENILKEKYDIDESLPLIIFKMDYNSPDSVIPIIEYEIYHPTNHSKLDLSYCENTFIKINVPISIDESNLIKYDPESEYYTDDCNSYTTDEGTDIILSDRKKEYNNEDLSICQNDCVFSGFDKENKNPTCDCPIKNKIDDISNIEGYSNKKSNKFEIEEEIPGFGSNLKTIKCTSTLFSKDGLKKNISNYFLLTFISIFIASFILYKKYGFPLLQNLIKKILESKKDFNRKKNSEQIAYTNILKLKNNSYNNASKRRINSMANFPPKKNISKEPSINNDINDINIVDYNSEKENDQKSKFSEKDKGDNLTMNNNEKKRKKIIDDNISEFGSISITRRDELKIKNTYIDYELNNFEYSEALLQDKRKYYQYYLSLIKRNQLIVFAFFPIKDYNLKIIKICIFCFSFALYYTTNYFYFSEKVIHKIYEDKGKYDFSYFLPKIIVAFFIAYYLTVLIKFFVLSERDIVQIKSAETYYQANEIIPKIKRKITIKYIIFFALGIAILIFLWFLISSFGSVYRNTQIIVFENTLISFGISLAYPFIYDVILCIFRVCALKYKKERLYFVSKILQIL